MAPTLPDSQDNEAALSARLLAVVRALVVELTPERAHLDIHLDSDLDRDLGFDSLSRVELLFRLERDLNVQLPEQAYASAETPRDLVRAARASVASGADTQRAFAVTAVETEPLARADHPPASVTTLQGVLAWQAKHNGSRTHVLLYETDAETPSSLTYAELQQGAERIAVGLVAEGLQPGDAVSIMLPTGRQYLESFFGVLLAGAIPVPIYPPARPSQLEDHLKRHAKILANAEARLLITVPEGRSVGRLLSRQVAGLKAVVTPEELTEHTGTYHPVNAHQDDTAFLQYTSGSTGQPKGVILSHANLLANIRAMGEWVRADSSDVFVSWLPLYHDMGLIGAWLGALYYAMLSVLMPPNSFLARPWRWFQAVHAHRATITAAPNFAYELCLAKVPESRFEGLDLSSLRLAFNGAEPVSPRTVRLFRERFEKHGFEPEAFCPVYGLAESAVGLAFPPLGRGPLIDRVARETFERTGRAETVGDGDCGSEDALEFVACGQPLIGYEIRIVDDAGRELPERQAGHLEFKGPSATAGYRNNTEATAGLFHGDWLDSGDLAYTAGGDVYLTGRVKDLIIRAGRNIYPYELEEAVGDLDLVRKGCVAVFGSRVRDADVEQLVVVAETRTTDAETLARLRQQIEALSSDRLGVAPDDVVLAPPRTVLKTSSGKIRRSACKTLYEEGQIGRGPRAAWWQLARVWLVGQARSMRSVLRSTMDLAYVAWCYFAFGLMMPLAVISLTFQRDLRRRWRSLGCLARGLLRMCRVPVVVRGLDTARLERCVLVANHASYLDGLLMVALLPKPVSFIAKAELAGHPFAGWFLRRIGAEFVERFDASQGTADAARLSQKAREDQPLFFFPEGTFTRYPGLLGFHLGAFLTAAENDLAVVPITIRGSRSVLRSDDWFPRRGAVAVIVGEPISSQATGWDAALELRNTARAEILRHVGEQDLALERGLS
jgi:1-acyl-sn-glycerol-3-phosphate acyltransferase